VLGRVDDHLVGAEGRAGGEEVGLAGAPRGQQRIAGAGEGTGRRGAASDRVCFALPPERWIEVGNDAADPAGRVGGAAAGSQREDLRRGPRLLALAKRALRRLLWWRRRKLEALGPLGPAGSEDRLQPAQLVDAYLWSAQEREGGRSSVSMSGGGGGGGGDGRRRLAAPPAAPLPMNGSSTSIGSGKTTVVFWLLPISSRVCR
jgi:hypothetical protein